MPGLAEGFPQAVLPSAFPWRGGGARTSAWWSPVVPKLPPGSSLCVSPRRCRGRPGREGALLPAPALCHGPVVGTTGAGIALRRVLETLGLCFKFQGHEPFPGKVKKKRTN